MPRKILEKLKLSREIISLSWNPRNLYQLATKTRLFNMKQKTLFQHMWKAKRDTRGYHDANITERQWLRMFNPRLPTLNVKLGNKASHPNAAALLYAGMERRLDFIVFRSHFASSIYMARQLVIHGKVTVNGKKLAYPSHTVKDGDVVSVDPESVVTLKKPDNGSQELEFVPVPYMQPWMFVPEYLEVNYNTCSTVFLHEPVTKPNATELPSPYPPEFHALAFKYYLRRGRSRE
ncbi:hypothetical protein FBU59_001185 [Linderina macrospora]|uniref:Uncharacterized protein n=1 Tax=Linderina macrospora TaxID=4868 RepID=A0ACC1JEQ8_9FUNG|nr:hypothetical protein FBU59_001185 [Linderina macrospora]